MSSEATKADLRQRYEILISGQEPQHAPFALAEHKLGHGR